MTAQEKYRNIECEVPTKVNNKAEKNMQLSGMAARAFMSKLSQLA